MREKQQIQLWIFAILTALSPILTAQVETVPESELKRYEAMLPELAGKAKGPLAGHLKKLSAEQQRGKRVNALRVALDSMENGVGTRPLIHYAVPALSDAQYLPDAYPYNGRPMAPVRIIAARGEYEPGSFILYPFSDLGRVELKLSPLKTADGVVFPVAKADLKVVKVWYQDKNAWYSYFGDQELKLVPELLLNDEDLIKVDTVTENNYVRLTEKDGSVSYRCITPPMILDSVMMDQPRRGSDAPVFRPMKENFQDAPVLQPVTLKSEEFKQFFLTVQISEDAVPGIYRGTVHVEKDGSLLADIPLELKILPFVLPKPKTYFDPDRDFIVSSYSYFDYNSIMRWNGGDYDLAVRQLKSILKNLAAHNQDVYWLRGDFYSRELRDQYEAMKEAGMRTDIIFGSSPRNGPEWMLKQDVASAKKYALDHFGHVNVYLGYGDEPNGQWLMNARKVHHAYQKEGFRFLMAGWDSLFHKAGYLYDWVNSAGAPEQQRDRVRRWNEIGHANVAWYATHHEGVENPSFSRRQNGLAPYLNNFSALCNYAHALGPWNDRSHTYRNMTIMYGCYDGVIDTLAWEGFREGIDDIRYATLLRQLALEASRSGNIDTAYAGRISLYYLASLNPESVDQDAARMEMIHHILKLRTLLGKEKQS